MSCKSQTSEFHIKFHMENWYRDEGDIGFSREI